MMSIEIMTWAWSLPIKKNLKYVLLALSDYADENGTCFPSIAKLAEKCSTTFVSIINTIKELCDSGILEKQKRYSNGKKSSNIYCINYQLSKESLPKESLHKEFLRKESLCKENETLSKETLCNSIKPSVKRQNINSCVQNKRKQKHGNKMYKKYSGEILNFLNDRSGKKYSPTEANLGFISLRLKEFEKFKPLEKVVEDCKVIIEIQCKEWGSDEKMQGYLRPATLFNKTKFSGYHGKINQTKIIPVQQNPYIKCKKCRKEILRIEASAGYCQSCDWEMHPLEVTHG